MDLKNTFSEKNLGELYTRYKKFSKTRTGAWVSIGVGTLSGIGAYFSYRAGNNALMGTLGYIAYRKLGDGLLQGVSNRKFFERDESEPKPPKNFSQPVP